jgi:outer membrane protein TolC
MKKNYLWRHLVLGCLLFAITPGAASAEGTVRELSVEQAVELAVNRNLSLERSRIDTRTLERAKDLRWNVLVPGIEASASLARENEAMTMPDGSAFRYSAAGSAGLRLSLSPANFTEMKQAVSNYERGLVSFENAKVLLELNVRKIFYGLLLLEENIKLAEQNIATAEKRFAQAQTGYKNGLVPELDALSAKVSLENLRPSLDEKTASLYEQLGVFKMYLGIDPAERVRVTGSIEPRMLAEPDADSLVPGALASRLDIEELKRAKAASVLGRDAAWQRAMLPELSLGWAYSPSLADPFEKSRWKQRDNFQDGGVFSISLSLAIDNLFPGSAARAGIAALDDSIKKQESRILELSRQAAVEIETLGKKIETSRKIIAALLLNAELAEKAYALTEDAYQQGSRELLALENAGDELQNARLQIVREKYNYITLIWDLEYALGLRFGTLKQEGL